MRSDEVLDTSDPLYCFLPEAGTEAPKQLRRTGKGKTIALNTEFFPTKLEENYRA